MIALLSLLERLPSASVLSGLFDAFDEDVQSWDWRDDFRLRVTPKGKHGNEIYAVPTGTTVLTLTMASRGQRHTMARAASSPLPLLFADSFSAIGLDPSLEQWSLDAHELYNRLCTCDALWTLLRQLRHSCEGSSHVSLAGRIAALATDWDAHRLTSFDSSEAQTRAMRTKESAIQADAQALMQATAATLKAVELLEDPRGAALRVRIVQGSAEHDIYVPAPAAQWMPVVPVAPLPTAGKVAKYAVQASRLDESVLAALMSTCVSGCTARLTRKLSSKVFPKVDAAMNALGGHWRSATQCYEFASDPTESIATAIACRAILTDRDYEFFATQPPQVARILELAELAPGQRVLEPQAGDGAIAVAIAEIVGLDNVDCYELMPRNVERLRELGFPVAEPVDFLSVQPDRSYDAVLLNPPFSQGRDIAHTLHALKFVKPGGRLVALLSTTWRHAGTAPARAFQTLLREMDAATEDVPDGAFKAVGTLVPTVIVTIEVPDAVSAGQSPAVEEGLRDLFDHGLALA